MAISPPAVIVDLASRDKKGAKPHCDRRGYSITKIYQDLGMRGSDDSRPQFQALLRDAREGLFDLIVVDELSRLSRQEPIESLFQKGVGSYNEV
jgi:site-specific DNA recombinase